MSNQPIPLPHELNESYRIAFRLLDELREIQVLSTHRLNSLTAEDVTAVVPALRDLARSASNMFTLAEQLRDSLSSTAHTIQWATSEKGRNATGRVEVQTTQGVVRETTVVEAILELGRVWWCTSMHVADEADKALAAVAAGGFPDAATIAAICRFLQSEPRVDDEEIAKLKVDLKREYWDVASVLGEQEADPHKNVPSLPPEVLDFLNDLPSDETDGLREAYRRDHLWLAWNENAERFGPAKIRDRWNSMSDAHRELVSPRLPKKVGCGLSGAATVKEGLKKARRERPSRKSKRSPKTASKVRSRKKT